MVLLAFYRMHSHLPPSYTLLKQRPFPPVRFYFPCHQQYYGLLRLLDRLRPGFHIDCLYQTLRFTILHTTCQDLSCSTLLFRNIPIPLRRWVLRCRTYGLFAPSLVFATNRLARLPLVPLFRGQCNDAAEFTLSYGLLLCHPLASPHLKVTPCSAG
jgi:hypothetical protein